MACCHRIQQLNPPHFYKTNKAICPKNPSCNSVNSENMRGVLVNHDETNPVVVWSCTTRFEMD